MFSSSSNQNRFPFAYGNFGLNSFGNQYLDKYRNFWDGPLLASTDTAVTTTTPTAGAPGNQAGIANATPVMTGAAAIQAMLKDPLIQNQPEAIRAAAINTIGNLANVIDLKGMIREQGTTQRELQDRLIEARKTEAAQANEWGKENLKLANEMNRSNTVLNTLLQMPGQISDSWARAATAGLPYQQEARQMMANTGANLQRGFESLTNANTQFGNQITNLYSNAAAYRPTIVPLAGKYFA